MDGSMRMVADNTSTRRRRDREVRTRTYTFDGNAATNDLIHWYKEARHEDEALEDWKKVAQIAH
jgi:hypothetical protein